MKNIIYIFIIYLSLFTQALSEVFDIICEGESFIEMDGYESREPFYDEYAVIGVLVTRDNKLTLDKSLQIRPGIISIKLINSSNYFSRDTGHFRGWSNIWYKKESNEMLYDTSYFEIEERRIINIVTKDKYLANGSLESNIYYTMSMTTGRLIYRAKLTDKKNNEFNIGMNGKCSGLNSVKNYLSQDY